MKWQRLVFKDKSRIRRSRISPRYQRDTSCENHRYDAYLATEFVFTLIIFSVALYVFSFFIMNVAGLENKLSERDRIDYIMQMAMVDERSYVKNYKGDIANFDLESSKKIEGGHLLVKRNFIDKKFGWVESEIRVVGKPLEKSIKIHTIIGVD